MAGAIGKGKKQTVIDILTKVKSKSKSKPVAAFKKNISSLEDAISKVETEPNRDTLARYGQWVGIFARNNTDQIRNNLDFFARVLRSEVFDQKDLVVKKAIQLIDEMKAKFRLEPKSGRTVTPLSPKQGLKGKQVENLSKTAPLDSSIWVSECFGKIANWLKNKTGEVLQISFSDCPEAFEAVHQDLSIIKRELERRDQLRTTERMELSSKLRELHSSLKQIAETAQDQRKIETSTSDPDDKVVNDIRNLFIDVCQRNQQVNQKPEGKPIEQGQDLRMALVRLYEQEINKLQEEVSVCSYDTEGVRTRMKEANGRMTDTLISIRRTLEERMSRAEKELDNIQREISHFRQELGECEQRKTGDHGIRDLAREINLLRKSMKQKENFTNADKVNEHARLELARLKQNLKETKEENEKLLVRFSRLAGAQLFDNNPNIADLSDSNRPTKIGDKFKEIYDTEWTDAYEYFNNTKRGQDEKQICSTLVNILEEAETYCTRLARVQQNCILVMLLKPNDPKETPSKKASDEKVETVLDAIHSNMINDLRKQTSNKSVEYVMKSFYQKVDIPQKAKQKEEVKKFVNKCAEICWHMSLQTPPVVLGKLYRTETKFNKSEYTEYTRKGSYINFVTWPPLLLHEGGPVLCKGVAQGKD